MEFTLSLFSVCSFKESPDFGTSRKNNTVEKPESPQSEFCSKYTIGWESDGRKVPILLGKYGYQFARLSQFDGFHCIFPCYGKLMRKPMHFPYDEVYQKFRI